MMNIVNRNTLLITLIIPMVMACTSLSSLEDRVDYLEERIKIIEAIIPNLNSNIEALQTLSGKTSIVSVESSNGRYKLTLANGEVINLTQGSIGTSTAPIMSIDKEGYWMVDYQDGNGAMYIKTEGEKVKALGEDGLTPEFGVDDDGFWTVSYDHGKTWELVKDIEGEPVSALPSEGADEYFKEVRIDEDIFVITLKTGETIKIPIVPDFMFVINGASSVQNFNYGELRTYTVVSRGISTASVISKPEGWTVTLSEETAQLIIVAPAATKASADTRTDISVLAVSESGLAVLSKVQVKISDN